MLPPVRSVTCATQDVRILIEHFRYAGRKNQRPMDYLPIPFLNLKTLFLF